MKSKIGKFLSFLVPVAAGAALLFFIAANRQPPQKAAASERSRAVRVMTVAPRDFVPRIAGYGTVAPPRTWDAVAQVAGRVEYVHPELRKGAILGADVEIIRISPKDYELEVKRAEANLASAKAKLNELEVQKANIERSLAIEKRSLELTRKDIERKRDLLERSATSAASLETAERGFLTQEARVQDLQNSLELSPVQIAAQRTQIEVNEAGLAIAKLNLERTRIALPFKARVSSTDVEEAKFVPVGSVLAAADDIGSAEVTAQMPLSQFAAFVRLTAPEGLKIDLTGGGGDGAVLAKLGWRATVRIGAVGRRVEWPARVLRTSDTIDPATRTIGTIVSVDEPYRDLVPGVRPPLVKGMFVEVELLGEPLAERIVAPRSAVRDGKIFVADSENRLRIREVSVRAVQGDEALIESGLEPGERVVLSDLSPVFDGMLLAPAEAAEATQ